MDYALPIAYALFLWWFSTGIIFFLDSLSVKTFKWSMAGATLVLAAALYVIWHTSGTTGTWAAYAAFSAGLLAWGWQEISLYMGFVTGPRKHRCAKGCSGWRHFGHAIAVNLWHEISIIVMAGVIVWLTWGAENQLALWTYLVLWGMHLSARLNVFLGVRNVSEEFVPAHMEVLKGFLTQKPMNLLFPFSVTAATIGSVLLFMAAGGASNPHDVTGYSLLAALMTLALLEHWFLVIPLPVERLWHWTLSSRKDAAKSRTELPGKFDYTHLKINLKPN